MPEESAGAGAPLLVNDKEPVDASGSAEIFFLFFIQILVWSITFRVFNPEKWFWTFSNARPSEKMNTDVS